MAKSARTSRKGEETHYNRKDQKITTGRTAGKRENPTRRFRDEDEAKSHDRRGNTGQKPFRKPTGNQSYVPRQDDAGDGRPAARNNDSGDKKPFRRDGDKPYTRKSFDDKKPYRKDDGDKKPFSKGDDSKSYNRDRPDKKTFEGKGGEHPAKRPYEDRNSAAERGEKRARKPFTDKQTDAGSERRKTFGARKDDMDKPFNRRSTDRKPYNRKESAGKPFARKQTTFDANEFVENTNPDKPGRWDTDAKSGPMTLNKYLAHSGVSSRRDAASMIKEGKVEVNGKVLIEPGYRVQPDDKITMDGKTMKPQRHFVYVLLNKPKDFLTTTEDDRGRRTVMELVNGATEDRLYPIGRLDRNTTGVLLLTNDGDLAQRLSHPRYESKKIYQVSLNKDLTKRDFDQIVEGVTLEDGPAKVDRLAYLDKKSEIGLEIHSGRNRIVRRIFESLGYEVEKLDRVMYAGLTKKNVSRGKWRFLTDKEVIALKHFRS